MKNIPKIEGSLSTRYTLALFVGFHRTIYKDIFEGLAEDYRNKLHIPLDWLNNYGFAISSITSLNRESRATMETFTVNEYDAERNRLLSIIFFLISNGLRSTKAEVKTAAQHLEIEMRPYKGIQSVSDDAKTTLVEGLLEDLNKEANTNYVTALGLTNVLTELEDMNTKFHSAKTKRVKATNAKLQNNISTQNLRADIEDLYDDICTMVYASALMAADDDERAFPLQTINEINVIVGRFKTSYKQSEARKGKDEEEEGTEMPPLEEEGEGGTQFEPIVPEEEETSMS